jgi:hypothetical protein
VRLRLEGERRRVAPAAQLDVVGLVLTVGRVGREQVRQPRPERVALGLEPGGAALELVDALAQGPRVLAVGVGAEAAPLALAVVQLGQGLPELAVGLEEEVDVDLLFEGSA